MLFINEVCLHRGWRTLESHCPFGQVPPVDGLASFESSASEPRSPDVPPCDVLPVRIVVDAVGAPAFIVLVPSFIIAVLQWHASDYSERRLNSRLL